MIVEDVVDAVSSGVSVEEAVSELLGLEEGYFTREQLLSRMQTKADKAQTKGTELLHAGLSAKIAPRLAQTLSRHGAGLHSAAERLLAKRKDVSDQPKGQVVTRPAPTVIPGDASIPDAKRIHYRRTLDQDVSKGLADRMASGRELIHILKPGSGALRILGNEMRANPPPKPPPRWASAY